MTTLRCTENDILAMQVNQNYICLCARLKDKFADNGIVTVVAVEMTEETLHIRLWLMSCRVLKRELEYDMMNTLVTLSAEKGIKRILGYYVPTLKNGMVKSFYDEMGFHFMDNSNGTDQWEIVATDYVKRETAINTTLFVNNRFCN